MKLGDLIKSLATKAGINVSELATKNPEFAGLLAMAAEVPDDVATPIETQLLTLDSAKNNGALKQHFFAQSLDGVDAVLEKIAKKRALPDDAWNTLKGEKNTMKRLEMLDDKIIELRDAKDNATSKTEKGQLQQQIDALQRELREAKEAHTAELTNRDTEFAGRETKLIVKALLAGKNFANKDLPMEVNLITAQTLIDAALAKEGLQMVNKSGDIRILKQDGSDYYDQKHNKVDATSFFDGVLSSNKMLAVSDQSKTDDKKNQDSTIVRNNDDKKVNTNLLNANSSALDSLSKAGYM